MGFTKIDNCWLDNSNGLTNGEFRLMMALERLLTGFHRISYVIPYSQISKMTGIKNVYLLMKSVKEKGLVNFESEDGKASNIQISKPNKLVSRSSYKLVSTPMEVNDIHHINNLHDPPLAKEKSIENLNKDSLFLEFKNKYPQEKINDDLDGAWSSLSNDHKQIAVGVMEYQNNLWNDPNYDRRYIPKASNFILKQLYLDDEIKNPYDDEIRRKKEIIERKKYLDEAGENAATESEKQEILNEFKKRKNNNQKNSD